MSQLKLYERVLFVLHLYMGVANHMHPTKLGGTNGKDPIIVSESTIFQSDESWVKKNKTGTFPAHSQQSITNIRSRMSLS